MTEQKAESIHVRCRHALGDISSGFSDTASVQTVKERLLAEWPKDGSLGPESPTSVADIRLILGGKFLENSESLDVLRQSLGDLADTQVITMHVVLRQPQAKGKKQEDSKGCSCVIC